MKTFEKIQVSNSTAVLLPILTFLTVLKVTSTTNIDWIRFRFEDNSNGVTCSSMESLFIRDNIADEVACSKICLLFKKCLTVLYYPESHQCTGCETIVFQTLPETPRSLQLSRRDFVMDCKDALAQNEYAESGPYMIRLPSSDTIKVLCDMESDGGGWTVIKNQVENGLLSFNQTFEVYENGFGDVMNEFWLGLRYIQELTVLPSEVYIMRFELGSGTSSFYVSSEFETSYYASDGFKLLGKHYIFLSKLQGSESNHQFYTYDRDTKGKCAAKIGHGWWYDEDFCPDIIYPYVKLAFRRSK